MSALSVAGHRDIPIQNPLTTEQLDSIVETCELLGTDSILDLGCGRGELLIRLVERWSCAAVGIDRSLEWLSLARAEARRRTPEGVVELVYADIRDAMTDGRFEHMGLIACVGATHALGGPLGILDRLAHRLRPGGWLVLGDGVWRTPPSAEVLAALGSTVADYPTIDGWGAAAARYDLTVAHVVDASGAGMDAYEGAFLSNLRAAIAAGEEVPGAAERIAWSEAHWPAISASLGFVVWVLRRAGSAADRG